MFRRIDIQTQLDKFSYTCRNLGLLFGVMLFVLIDGAEAQPNQIKPDSTLGAESSVIQPNVGINGQIGDVIEGGANRGENLFHSFSDFNIGEGNRVYFRNPAQIQRIFSRVTGSNSSAIFGTLGVLGTADLFLVNPNGIIFGPNAVLDVKGSFIATSASEVIFEDGTRFSTVNSETSPLLSVSIPIGLQFRNHPGSIVNQSQSFVINGQGFQDIGGLQVQPNKTLALVGGEIILKGGFITADGGRVELGSVTGSEQVSLKPVAKGWMLSYDGVQNYGDIRLQQDVFQLAPNFFLYSQINANGNDTVQEGGDIQLQGRRVILIDGSRIAAAANFGTQPGGSIIINASESVEVSGNPQFLRPAVLSTSVLYDGNGRNLEINTKQVILRDFAFITSESISVASFPEPTGKVGDIIINASDSVSISNSSRITTSTLGTGDAGKLQINTQKLTLQEKGQINAASTFKGNGGSILVNANQINLEGGSSITVNSTGTGKAGNINLNASSLRLLNGSSLDAATQSGEGNITLNVQNETILWNNSQITTNSTGNEMGSNGGNIFIDTGVLGAFRNSDITANSENAAGGKVIINTQGIFRTLDSEITATSKLGPEFNGIVELNTPEIDPSRGLVLLPENVVDPTALVVQNPCTKDTGNGFIITGRGGLPPSINDELNRDAVQVELVEPVYPQKRPTTKQTSESQRKPIEAAQGWIFNQQGEVVLTAYNATVTEPQRLKESVSCPAL